MANNAQQPKIDENLRPLRQRYLQRLKEQVQELNRFMNLCEKKLLGDEDGQALRAQAHKLAGTGRTYGFQDISRCAKTVEEALLANPKLPAEQLAPLLRQLIFACEHAEESEVYETPPQEITPKEVLQQMQQRLPLILTIDDDDNITGLIAELFKNRAEVMVAGSANEGAKMMKARRPDIVLLDDMMPGGVSGLHMLEVIQKDPELAQVSVIMLTTSGGPRDVMRGYVAGAIDYITKPFDPGELSRKITDHLTRQNATILVVDDDENVTDLLAYKLQALGYRVELCENGIRALSVMEKIVPAMVILDRMMPGMDGMALLQKMRQNPALKSVPVVFLTARRQEADIVEGLRLGASDYILKPFNPDEVIVRMERFLKTAA